MDRQQFTTMAHKFQSVLEVVLKLLNQSFQGLDHVVGHPCRLCPRQKRLQTKGLEHPREQPSS
jgi:hypothetical protein